MMTTIVIVIHKHYDKYSSNNDGGAGGGGGGGGGGESVRNCNVVSKRLGSTMFHVSELRCLSSKDYGPSQSKTVMTMVWRHGEG